MDTVLILSFSETALENLKKTALLSKPTPLNFFNFYLFQILKIFAGVSANLRQRKFFSKFFTFFKLAETEYIGLAEFLSASSAKGACRYRACLPPKECIPGEIIRNIVFLGKDKDKKGWNASHPQIEDKMGIGMQNRLGMHPFTSLI